MSDKEVMERQGRRELRGSILRTAHIVYAEGGRVTLDNFRHVAGKHTWTLAQVTQEVRYLAEKGYLEEHKILRDARDDEPPIVYSLTARGVDLLNGDLTDDAIEL